MLANFDGALAMAKWLAERPVPFPPFPHFPQGQAGRDACASPLTFRQGD